MTTATLPDLDALPGSALLRVGEAAAALGITKSTLNTWRCRSPERCPPAVRIGAAVRFEVATLRAWIAARREA